MEKLPAGSRGFIVTAYGGELHGVAIEKGDTLQDVIKAAQIVGVDEDALIALAGLTLEKARQDREVVKRRNGYGRIW
jgi:hypothetical protein